MSPAVASLLALLGAIALSIASRINVGVVAFGLAWLIGVQVAGLDALDVIGGFPGSLFVTLTGVTLLFAAAEANGTLERLTRHAVGLVRGRAALLPGLFFTLAFAVSTVGPGAIASVALVAPLAMAVGTRSRVPPFLTALMVATGANAGNLSPVSSVGVIANTAMARAGLGGHQAKVWFANFAAHILVALAAYLLLRGHRLGGAGVVPGPAPEGTGGEGGAAAGALSGRQWLTAAVVGLWIVGVLAGKLHLGLSAFAAAGLLIGFRATDEGPALRRVPWGVIIMVTGVTVLIGLLERTGGMDLFTTLLSRLARPGTVNGVIAFVTGSISTYSSTSGVVLPAFLPTVPGLVAKLGGGDPLAVALSINVGASLVDVSPLSTLGALCVATVPDGPAAQALFRRLLLWGLAMALVGAALCQTLAGPLARL